MCECIRLSRRVRRETREVIRAAEVALIGEATLAPIRHLKTDLQKMRSGGQRQILGQLHVRFSAAHVNLGAAACEGAAHDHGAQR